MKFITSDTGTEIRKGSQFKVQDRTSSRLKNEKFQRMQPPFQNEHKLSIPELWCISTHGGIIFNLPEDCLLCINLEQHRSGWVLTWHHFLFIITLNIPKEKISWDAESITIAAILILLSYLKLSVRYTYISIKSEQGSSRTQQIQETYQDAGIWVVVCLKAVVFLHRAS